MRMIYLANARIPTEKAHGIQIMQMCKGFSLSDVKKIDVELVVPRRLNKIKQNPFDYYGIEKCFKITYLPCLDFLPWVKFLGRLSLAIQTVTFFISAFFYLFNKKFDIIYTRDEFASLFLFGWRKKIVWEAHNLSKMARFLAFCIRRIWGIVAITGGLKAEIIKIGVESKKIFVSPDGVDLNLFDLDISKDEAQKKLGLPPDKKIILYVGHLYKWKGAMILVEAARSLPTDALVILVGGTESDIKDYKLAVQGMDNIMMIGYKPHREIPLCLKAADILVLPNSGKEQISREFTSPLKLFEYMASCRPIVASDVPSIGEILVNEKNALLFKSDEAQDLALKIAVFLDNPNLSDKIAAQARLDVQNYSWEERVRKVLFFIDDKAKK